MLRPFALLLLLFFVSCSQRPLFEKDVVFDDLIWNRFNIIEMDVDVVDVDQLYDVYVQFVHTDVYPTDYISMNITFYFPNGGMRSRDYEFSLQDAQLQWIGKKTEHYYTNYFPVILGLRFPESGTTRVRIENKMTKFNIAGIASVGLFVGKTGTKP
jgi:gliding motility-associated lipoprotein GldH